MSEDADDADDAVIESDLPDISRMSLLELRASQDPLILAAVERIREQVLSRGPDEVVEVTMWPALKEDR